jgi:hypothetical protein
MASSLEMTDRDFDRQATLGGLLSALRGTNESMTDGATAGEAALMSTDQSDVYYPACV